MGSDCLIVFILLVQASAQRITYQRNSNHFTPKTSLYCLKPRGAPAVEHIQSLYGVKGVHTIGQANIAFVYKYIKEIQARIQKDVASKDATSSEGFFVGNKTLINSFSCFEGETCKTTIKYDVMYQGWNASLASFWHRIGYEVQGVSFKRKQALEYEYSLPGPCTIKFYSLSLAWGSQKDDGYTFSPFDLFKLKKKVKKYLYHLNPAQLSLLAIDTLKLQPDIAPLSNEYQT
ncbi:hypothetical protein DSO57_1001900 [Entomophthora muscae]|uniref:Uncharacterized protein n=1 Tax=Entomophthora muscae TaxID=34485 RepID=A0ACC2TK93_9FUNG|nr:hypothetical protein DSO57_1001900 [Entomophthora muscae]